MRILLTSFLALAIGLSEAQVNLKQTDLNNLVALGKAYSQNTNARGSEFAKTIDSLRTPILDPIVDALISVGKGDSTILESRFLSRPNDDELMLWYVLREIHYNRVNKTQKIKPDIDVANEVLSRQIDTRWLLDNYYYRIHGGIATLFNDADLSTLNINIDSLGFKNEAEKAIFFLNIMDALVGGRFKVLQSMKNNKKILEFSDKLPMFNGKRYYYYKKFSYEDFDWIGYDKTESYNERHIGGLYSTLIPQFIATSDLRGKEKAREIYYNSILSEPKYFKFTPSKDDLQSVYDKSEKHQ